MTSNDEIGEREISLRTVFQNRVFGKVFNIIDYKIRQIENLNNTENNLDDPFNTTSAGFIKDTFYGDIQITANKRKDKFININNILTPVSEDTIPAEDEPIRRLIMDAKNSIMGNRDFRPGQFSCIYYILKGHDVFGSIPTGGGKSLIYILSGIISEGMTIVICPLVSLMQDQMNKLTSYNITSGREFIPEMEGNNLTSRSKFIFVAPEKLVGNNIVELRRLNITRIVIDEAHTVSVWGKDFRPKYEQLGMLRKMFPQSTILALTATSVPEVKHNIMSILKMNHIHFDPNLPSNRYNLRLSVVRRTNNIRDFAQQVIRKRNEFIAIYNRLYPGQLQPHSNTYRLPGVIYVTTGKTANLIANQLNHISPGIASAYYADAGRSFIKKADAKYVNDWTLDPDNPNFNTRSQIRKQRRLITAENPRHRYLEYHFYYRYENNFHMAREGNYTYSDNVVVNFNTELQRIRAMVENDKRDGKNYKNTLLQNWITGTIDGNPANLNHQIIVATIAFGMGIDKPDCRHVYHYNLSKNIENYWQEVGRAGRDGNLSDCVVFYDVIDRFNVDKFTISNQELSHSDKTLQFIHTTELQDLVESTSDCLHTKISSYFTHGRIVNLPPDHVKCNTSCSNCLRNKNEQQINSLLDEMVIDFPKNISPTTAPYTDLRTIKSARYLKMIRYIFELCAQTSIYDREPSNIEYPNRWGLTKANNYNLNKNNNLAYLQSNYENNMKTNPHNKLIVYATHFLLKMRNFEGYQDTYNSYKALRYLIFNDVIKFIIHRKSLQLEFDNAMFIQLLQLTESEPDFQLEPEPEPKSEPESNFPEFKINETAINDIYRLLEQRRKDRTVLREANKENSMVFNRDEIDPHAMARQRAATAREEAERVIEATQIIDLTGDDQDDEEPFESGDEDESNQ